MEIDDIIHSQKDLIAFLKEFDECKDRLVARFRMKYRPYLDLLTSGEVLKMNRNEGLREYPLLFAAEIKRRYFSCARVLREAMRGYVE